MEYSTCTVIEKHMMMNNDVNDLIMLGVVHRDSGGYRLLAERLEQFMPDIITLEFSHYGLNYRRVMGKTYKKRIMEVILKYSGNREKLNRDAFSELVSFANVPYEYRASVRYTDKHSGLLHLIDLDMFSYVKLQKSEELFSPSNIERLLFSEQGFTDHGERAVARLFFEGGIKIYKYTEEMFIRDRYMSGRISMIKNENKNKRLLHICGWQHLDDPYELYAPLNPRKVFIYDKTDCF